MSRAINRDLHLLESGSPSPQTTQVGMRHTGAQLSSSIRMLEELLTTLSSIDYTAGHLRIYYKSIVRCGSEIIRFYHVVF